MSTTVAGKPPRKFPPLCWTRDEALVLIEAYRQRWYAVHRAFLKNPDWDAVAEKVTTACPDVTPPKTSAQCRHKMEKLRQRHRAEKLRAAAFPGGSFSSSWFYFQAMEAVEKGHTPESRNDNNNNNPNDSDHQRLNPLHGIRFKPSDVQKLVTLAATPINHTPDFDSRVSNHSWLNQENHNEDGYVVDDSPAFRNQKCPLKPSVPYARKYSKVVHDHEADEDGEMWVKVPRGTIGANGLTNGKKKKGDGGIVEVVSAIKVLGDGFMRMEKMKIDMVREMERMRMEMEMKRNELILESQRQIVDAFVKGLVETRKQRRTEAMEDS